jgi:hypothetical protein
VRAVPHQKCGPCYVSAGRAVLPSLRVLAYSIMVIVIGHGLFAVSHLTDPSKCLRPDISVQQCRHLPVVLLGGWLLLKSGQPRRRGAKSTAHPKESVLYITTRLLLAVMATVKPSFSVAAVFSPAMICHTLRMRLINL